MSNPHSRSPRLRILIVEDHKIVSLGIEAVLLDAGHEVVASASSATEALKVATDHRPDLILMDIKLAGGTDGVEAAIQIRDQLGIPSIFFTGHVDADTRERASAASPLAIIDKSLSIYQISKILDELAIELPDRL